MAIKPSNHQLPRWESTLVRLCNRELYMYGAFYFVRPGATLLARQSETSSSCYCTYCTYCLSNSSRSLSRDVAHRAPDFPPVSDGEADFLRNRFDSPYHLSKSKNECVETFVNDGQIELFSSPMEKAAAVECRVHVM